MRGTVELLEDHFGEMTEDERSRFLGIIAGDTERLERLVRRLLELARAETFTAGNERTNTLPVLEDLLQRYRAQGLEILLQGEGEPAQVRMGRENPGIASIQPDRKRPPAWR